MKKLLSLVAAILFAATSFAQVDEVTLTVIGTGVNEILFVPIGRGFFLNRRITSEPTEDFSSFVPDHTVIPGDPHVQEAVQKP